MTKLHNCGVQRELQECVLAQSCHTVVATMRMQNCLFNRPNVHSITFWADGQMHGMAQVGKFLFICCDGHTIIVRWYAHGHTLITCTAQEFPVRSRGGHPHCHCRASLLWVVLS
jgi:hypothetical protein